MLHSEIKVGLNFVCVGVCVCACVRACVCVLCHHMMYRKCVVFCNKVKYTKASTVTVCFKTCLVQTPATLALMVKSGCVRPVTEH